MMNCMIVEDDLMSCKSLERLCKKVEDINVVRICENGKEALEAVSHESLDLIFLDIEMPELNGIDFLNNAVSLPQVIFTTSKTEYAYDAFEYQVTDYLKKPIAFPRFQIAVEKAIETHKKNNAYRTKADEVYIREEGRLVRVPYDDILYFENVGDYVRVKTTAFSHVIHGTLKGIDAKLTNPEFLKVHRSFIVNLSKIKDIEENTLVIDKKVIPISRANKPILMGRLNLL
ncbi:LytTR family DNA-binding domain-containing protein [Saprospiraceae bacterium]|nr:LytTR family DNA-binding domain-containing protein [Saprospiraceae bacterium]